MTRNLDRPIGANCIFETRRKTGRNQPKSLGTLSEYHPVFEPHIALHQSIERLGFVKFGKSLEMKIDEFHGIVPFWSPDVRLAPQFSRLKDLFPMRAEM
jgi:hypothetical protein